MEHLRHHGFTCPALVNPSDFILDLTSIDFRTSEKQRQSTDRLQLLKEAYNLSFNVECDSSITSTAASLTALVAESDLLSSAAKQRLVELQSQLQSLLTTENVINVVTSSSAVSSAVSISDHESESAPIECTQGVTVNGAADVKTGAETSSSSSSNIINSNRNRGDQRKPIDSHMCESSPSSGEVNLLERQIAYQQYKLSYLTQKQKNLALALSISSSSSAAAAATIVKQSDTSNVILYPEKSVFITLPLLLKRSYQNISRQPVLLSVRVTQGLFYALILCAFYAPTEHNQASIQNRIGNLQQLCSLIFIGMLSCIAIFPHERNVFYREYVDGGYPLYVFFLTYFLISVPVNVFASCAISILVTYAIGLKASATGFVVFSYVVYCLLFAGECVGVIFCAMFMHIGFSVNIMSLLMSIFVVIVGFLSLNMPTPLVYLSYVSPMTWSAKIMSETVFRGWCWCLCFCLSSSG